MTPAALGTLLTTFTDPRERQRALGVYSSVAGAVGGVLGAAAMAYLTQLGLASSYVAGVLPALIMLGVAFGLILPPAIATATAGVLPQDTGVASALVNTMQQAGGSIGVSALSTVALSATVSYLSAHRGAGRLVTADAAIHGYTVAFTVAGLVFAVAAVLAFGLLPSRQGRQAGGRLAGGGDTAGTGTAADALAGDTGHQSVRPQPTRGQGSGYSQTER